MRWPSPTRHAAGWALHGAALPRLLGRTEPAGRAPTTRVTSRRSAGSWAGCGCAGRPLQAAGVSLGGNALLRWAQEAGDSATVVASAVVAVSLAGRSGSQRPGHRTRLQPAGLHPHVPAHDEAQGPGQAGPAPGAVQPRGAAGRAHDLYQFDNLFTAPLHGFRDTEDYWARASAKPHLARIRIPALVINALNDPFVPAASLPRAGEVGRWVQLWQPPHGGHVGFPQGRFPGHVHALPQAVAGWLQQHR
jgi:predicted alpha/beta-fold hydrolase